MTEPQTTSSLRSATKWSFVMTWGQHFLNAGLMFVLAAILGPAEFGLVAIAAVYIFFMQVLLEQGLIAAIIQRKDLSRGHLDSAFWLTLSFSLVLTAASILLAGWWAGVNRLPELAAIIRVLSIAIPIQGLTIVQQASLQRRMDFRALAMRTVLAVAVAGAVGISLALGGFGVWALVAQQLTMTTVAMLVLWSVSDWRPGLRFSWGHARDLFGFSTGAFLQRLCLFARNRSDALLMGIFFGPVAVGLYKMADRLTAMVFELGTRSFHVVAFPHLSRIQDDGVELRRKFRQFVEHSTLLTLPVVALLLVVGEDALAILGEQWRPAVTALQLLCVFVSLHIPVVFSGSLIQALGKPHLLAVFLFGEALVCTSAYVVVGLLLQDGGAWQQAAGIALARTLSMALFLPVYYTIAARMCGLRLMDLLRAAAPAAVAVGVVLMVGALIDVALPADASVWLSFAVLAVGAGASGLAAAAMASPLLRRELLGVIRRVRRGPEPAPNAVSSEPTTGGASSYPTMIDP